LTSTDDVAVKDTSSSNSISRSHSNDSSLHSNIDTLLLPSVVLEVEKKIILGQGTGAET
jgi:hypothetical protein